MYNYNYEFLRFSDKSQSRPFIYSTPTLVYRNFCPSPSSPQYILLAVAIASVKVSFRGTCNIYRGERSGSKRERTRGNSRQLPFQTGVKSHNLVMGKFVRSDRELFPHLADTRCDHGVVQKNWHCWRDARSDDPYSRDDLSRTLTTDKCRVRRYISDMAL